MYDDEKRPSIKITCSANKMPTHFYYCDAISNGSVKVSVVVSF